MGTIGNCGARGAVERDIGIAREDGTNAARAQCRAQLVCKRKRICFFRSCRIQHRARVRAAVGRIQQHDKSQLRRSRLCRNWNSRYSRIGLRTRRRRLRGRGRRGGGRPGWRLLRVGDREKTQAEHSSHRQTGSPCPLAVSRLQRHFCMHSRCRRFSPAIPTHRWSGRSTVWDKSRSTSAASHRPQTPLPATGPVSQDSSGTQCPRLPT